MPQPIRNEIKKKLSGNKRKNAKKIRQSKRKHKEYGTSKLEERFANEFLEKFKIKYLYQFKAESIGRYFDFFLPDVNLIIEVDGDYWHSYGKVYEEMNPTQKRNRRVDEAKNKWAHAHCIPILRIWEHDINKNPQKVMKILEEKIGECSNKKVIEDNKKKRH